MAVDVLPQVRDDCLIGSSVAALFEHWLFLSLASAPSPARVSSFPVPRASLVHSPSFDLRSFLRYPLSFLCVNELEDLAFSCESIACVTPAPAPSLALLRLLSAACAACSAC